VQIAAEVSVSDDLLKKTERSERRGVEIVGLILAGAPSQRSVRWFARQRPKALRVGRPNKGELFFFFLLFLFSVHFEILGKIKNA
jgi:hypothetical protein